MAHIFASEVNFIAITYCGMKRPEAMLLATFRARIGVACCQGASAVARAGRVVTVLDDLACASSRVRNGYFAK